MYGVTLCMHINVSIYKLQTHKFTIVYKFRILRVLKYMLYIYILHTFKTLKKSFLKG